MALESFCTASRLDPTLPLPHEEASFIYEIHHQDPESALQAVSRALLRSSRRAAVFYTAGNLHSAFGRPARAAALHQRAIALDGAFFEAYNNLGSAYIAMANAADIATELQVLIHTQALRAAERDRLCPASRSG